MGLSKGVASWPLPTTKGGWMDPTVRVPLYGCRVSVSEQHFGRLTDGVSHTITHARTHSTLSLLATGACVADCNTAMVDPRIRSACVPLWRPAPRHSQRRSPAVLCWVSRSSCDVARASTNIPFVPLKVNNAPHAARSCMAWTRRTQRDTFFFFRHHD